MTWTILKPTQPGWYWYRKNEEQSQVLMHVQGDWRADDRVWPEGRWESVFHMPGEWSGHWSVRCHNKLDERASCKLPKLLQCLKLCY